MNIQEQIKNQQLKKKLQSKKEDRIKQKLAAKHRQKVNLDHSHLKTGKMEKTKIIQKKKFKTEVQKARKIERQIQDNANPGTYIGESQEYEKVLERTRNYVKFDKDKLSQGCQAIIAFAEANKQKTIDVVITMENQIQCHETPVLLRLPHPQQRNKCIIITKVGQKIEQKMLKHADIRLLTLPQLLSKMKQEKHLKKQIHKKETQIFSNFTTFSKSKPIKKLLKTLIPVFPIDTNKVPYTLAEEMPTYHDYLKFLMQSVYFVAHSGKQFTVRLRTTSNFGQFFGNVQSVVHQAVAKLIVRSKAKGNRLASVKLKSQSSIPIDVYVAK